MKNNYCGQADDKKNILNPDFPHTLKLNLIKKKMIDSVEKTKKHTPLLKLNGCSLKVVVW